MNRWRCSRSEHGSPWMTDSTWLSFPEKVYDFYHLNEADYTVMASEIRPGTIEILL